MTTSELIDLQMTALKVQNDETLVYKKIVEKSASDKACDMDPYLAPHKGVIQARYNRLIAHFNLRL